jgi:hypothetical protein
MSANNRLAPAYTSHVATAFEEYGKLNRRRTSASSFALLLTLLAALPAKAALRYDGTVLIYPNGVIQGEAGNDPQQFKAILKFGLQIFVDTSDAPATVIAWYRAHLPAAFSVHVLSVGTQFESGNKVVNVVKWQGKTRIGISPG